MAATLAELKNSPLYSEELGIALARDDDHEYFKWFLASLLFSGRISATIARHAYQAFAENGLLQAQDAHLLPHRGRTDWSTKAVAQTQGRLTCVP